MNCPNRLADRVFLGRGFQNQAITDTVEEYFLSIPEWWIKVGTGFKKIEKKLNTS